MVQCNILAPMDPAENPGRLFVFPKSGTAGLEHIIILDANNLTAINVQIQPQLIFFSQTFLKKCLNNLHFLLPILQQQKINQFRTKVLVLDQSIM